MAEFYIYSIARRDTPVCKIGMSSNVKSRISTLQTGSAEELTLVFKSGGFNRTMAECIERTCHYLLDDVKISGEWFSVGHEMSQMVIEAAIDLLCVRRCEHDYPFIVDQTKFQIEQDMAL